MFIHNNKVLCKLSCDNSLTIFRTILLSLKYERLILTDKNEIKKQGRACKAKATRNVSTEHTKNKYEAFNKYVCSYTMKNSG